VTATTHDGAALAAAWRLLSLGFTPPTHETLAEVEVLAEALGDADPSPELASVLAAVRGVERDELAAEFARLFRGTVLVAPYEGSYELDPIRQGRELADIAAFYRAFDAEAHGPASERPDFVGCELEFLAFLEIRLLAARETGEDGLDILEEIRGSFLADHAARWLPAFFAAVVDAASPASPYAALAHLGERVLALELARSGIEPSRLPRRGPATALDADTLECGGALAETSM
jgi:TorA maturation chaperone TorD